MDISILIFQNGSDQTAVGKQIYSGAKIKLMFLSKILEKNVLTKLSIP